MSWNISKDVDTMDRFSTSFNVSLVELVNSLHTYQQRDNQKKVACSQHGVTLFQIPYSWDKQQTTLISIIKSGCFISSNNSRANFELSLRQLLVNLLNDNDKQILHRRLYSCGSAEVEAQLRLFIQLKLFGPQGSDLDKILRYRSSKQVTQWMDKERAASMKDAIERTLRRHTERIEPLRKAFVEFLMMSDNCAAGVLDFVVDMNPDF
jgi:hypothetical protein